MHDLIASTHLWLTGTYSPEMDEFMLILSGIAEWFPWVLAVAIAAMGIRRRAAMPYLLPLLSQTVCTLMVQPIKHLIAAPRPLTWFAAYYPDVMLRIVPGCDNAFYLSFPSGHTASAFALAASLVYMLPRDLSRSSRLIIGSILFVIACMVGYSRIYLHQHFLHDVAAGAIFGLASVWIAQAVLRHFAKSTLQK